MKTTLRPATAGDSRHIAQLFQMSSDGVADVIWRGVGGEGADLLDIGAQRYARDGEAFSYQNCVIAEQAGVVAGMAHAFEIKDPAGPDEIASCDVVLRPFLELEVPGLYLSGLAVFPGHRNHGTGTMLLRDCYRRARADNLPLVSLICFEANEGAHRLYIREGFGEVKRRQIVPHPLIHHEGDALLLVREISQTS